MSDSQSDEIARLEALFAANPEGRIFTHLAEAYRKNGDLAQARDVLEGGIARHPDYSSAHVVYGRVLRDLGEAGAARDAFRRVLDLDPHNMVALRALGDIALESGDREEAARHYETLLSLEPGSEELQSLVASARAPAVDAWSPWDREPEAGEEVGFGDERELPIEPEGEVGELPAEGDVPAEGLDLETFDRADAGLAGWSDAEEEAESIGWSESSPGAMDLTLGAVEEEGWEEESAAFDEEALQLPPSGDEPVGEPEPATSPEAEAAFDVRLEGGTGAEASSSAESDSAVVEHMEEELVTPAPDLETETIADLYLQQGLFERAAGVYRKLLESRPGDEPLQRKLAEAESALTASGEPAAEGVGTGTAAEELASGWIQEPEGETSAAPTPYAWHEESASEEAAGAPISEYFSSLLSWKPASWPEPGSTPQDAPAVEGAPEEITESPGASEPVIEGEPWQHEAMAEETSDVPETASAPTTGTEPGPQAETDAGPGALAVPDEIDALFASTSHAAGGALGEGGAGRPDDSIWGEENRHHDDVDALFATPASSAPGAEPARPAQPLQERGEGVSGDEAPSGGGGRGGEARGDEEEDLEMFRAWLQSLKR